MTEAVTATVIDAMVSIESIRVTDRHRRDMGDLQALGDSIADVGLLNPITMTRDSRLIAGQRRLEACRLLDWAAIPVRFVDTLDDAAKLLRAERDENVCRLDMKPSEMAALGEALYEIEQQAAKQRQREHGGTAPGRPANTHGSPAMSVQSQGAARDRVGEALGMSPRLYAYLRSAHRLANDADTPEEERALGREALAEMDRTGSIQPVADRMTAKLRAKRDAREVVAASAATEPAVDLESEPESRPATDSEADDLWVPNNRSFKSAEARAQRKKLITHYAARGETSQQIADQLGMRAGTVKRIAREEGIEVVADRVVGRGNHSIDSNRIVRETVQSLEYMETSLNLIRFDRLDRSEIENWTTSLSKSIRMLNRLNKQLKEMVQ